MTTFHSLSLDDIDPNWAQEPNPRWRLGSALGTPGGMIVPVDKIFVHHTVSPDTGDVVADVSGPCDTDQRKFGKVSYSWNIHESTDSVVEVEGTHRGAHTINNAQQSLNGVSFGFGVIGNFHPSAPNPPPRAPSDHLIELIAAAIVEKVVIPGLANPGFAILGHRDVFATACCGDLLYDRLDDIRALVANPPAPPIPEDPDMPAAFIYNNDLDTFAVDSAGNLATRYFQPSSGWHKLLLGGGCVPNAEPKIVRGYKVGVDDPGRLDVFVEATGGLAHAWYTLLEKPTPQWHFEILA